MSFKKQALKKINEANYKKYENIYKFAEDMKKIHVNFSNMSNGLFDSTILNKYDKSFRVSLDNMCNDIESKLSHLRHFLNQASKYEE